MRTQVGIVGAGPAGLLLSQVLRREGIDAVVLEHRSRDYVEQRIRAGVLEQGTVDLLRAAGVGARLDREGMVHRGVNLRFERRNHRIDLAGLTGGSVVTVYGQTEIVKDLLHAHDADGAGVVFNVGDVTVVEPTANRPRLRFSRKERVLELECDYIAGCDGFHGVCRPSIPAGVISVSERTYPFAWLGILADVEPSADEVTYAYHEHGFALLSMRSRSVSRLYLQCEPDEDLAEWPDDRIWEELQRRLGTDDGWTLRTGPIRDKSVNPMRSFVAQPMQYGRLFLAGDAAHIVPPTGAKGLNLAIADVRMLSEALIDAIRNKRTGGLDSYSENCLRRVWRAQHFSWWMTSILHNAPGADRFARELQLSQLRYVVNSEAASRSLAENYTGIAPA
ncbi:MAG TPA: 4-hydroxybenzoate 3-monooxygenase [Gammaproteobacteria bacterium]